jgi:hypothetical protein
VYNDDPGPADTFGSPASTLGADTASVDQSFDIEVPVVDIDFLIDEEPMPYLISTPTCHDDDAGCNSGLTLDHAGYKTMNYSAVLYLETIADEAPVLQWIPCLQPVPPWLWPLVRILEEISRKFRLQDGSLSSASLPCASTLSLYLLYYMLHVNGFKNQGIVLLHNIYSNNEVVNASRFSGLF